MTTRRTAIPTLMLLICSGPAASAAPIWDDTSIGASVTATMGAEEAQNSDSAAVLVPEHVSLDGVPALATDGTNFASATADMFATFDRYAGDGTASYEIEIQALDSSSVDLGVGLGMTFRPDQDGVLVFEYDVSGDAWSLQVTSPPPFNVEPEVPLVGTGSFQHALIAGQLFHMRAGAHVAVSCPGDCDLASQGSASFRWTIVPEPSTSALVGAGVLALGLARRRA
jgi:PEP-CTERM motif-containing protein